MAGTGESDLKRCLEGHVFDVARHETCPTCGSPVAGRARNAQAEESQAAKPVKRDKSDRDADREDTVRKKELLEKLPTPLRGLRGLALAGGALGAALLVAAVLTSREDAPSRAVTNAVQEAEPVEDKPPAPTVIMRQDEAAAPVPKADEFNPSTADAYGLWEMYTPTANQGPTRQVIEIRPDDSFTIYSGPFGFSGSIKFVGRTFQLRSRTTAYQDAGAFSRPDPNSLVFEGRLGRSAWARVRQPALFDLADERPNLPVGLAATLGRMTGDIRASWREDAVPVEFKVKREDHGAYNITVAFLSPQDSTGLSVTWGRFHSSEYAMGGVTWFDKPLPESFVDLHQAYAALGAVGPLDRAELGYFNLGGGGGTYDRNAPPSWSIILETGTHGNVDATVR